MPIGQNFTVQKPFLPFKNQTCQGVHFINTRHQRFKCKKMVLKCQKWRLTFSKFHKTILAFKTPKCDVVITNIGVCARTYPNPKKISKKTLTRTRSLPCSWFTLIHQCPKLAFKFYEMDPRIRIMNVILRNMLIQYWFYQS